MGWLLFSSAMMSCQVAQERVHLKVEILTPARTRLPIAVSKTQGGEEAGVVGLGVWVSMGPALQCGVLSISSPKGPFRSLRATYCV